MSVLGVQKIQTFGFRGFAGKKTEKFGGLGEPLNTKIFQKYFTQGVFVVNGILWWGKTLNFQKKVLFEST